MTYEVAFVGTGHIASTHLDGLQALNSYEGHEVLRLTAVVDNQPGLAARWRAENLDDGASVSVLEDYRDLLRRGSRPDIVCLLVPHHLHLEMALSFLEAGVAVQLQKPIGLAISDSRQIVDGAARTGTPLVISEPSILGRETRRTIEALRDGSLLGDVNLMIDHAVIDLHGGFFVTPWRHLKGMAGAGWFIDHGVHRTHWMLEALGPCRSAFAKTRILEPARRDDRFGQVEVDTEDLATALLTFESGTLVQWSVVSGGVGNGYGHVELWGATGSLHDDEVTRRGPDGGAARTTLTDELGRGDEAIPVDPFAHSFQELVGRIEDPAFALIGDPAAALEAEAIVYAGLESAYVGVEVPVAEILSGRRHSYEDTVWRAGAAGYPGLHG